MEIYQRYGPALIRKCERMLGAHEDAEDVVQTLFVKLLKQGKTDHDLPYLFRSATNLSLNLIRNRKTRQSLLHQHAPTHTPARTLLDDRVVDADIVRQLVAQLDKKSAEILVYRYLDDMTQTEISELMRLSRKTVGTRLKKIRKQAEKLWASDKVSRGGGR
jgi:RNA polymerase sigma-70 factor (ECF subfamily)